jgi:hypothetical protein
MVAKATSQQATAVQTAKRYLGVSLVRELSTLTPGHISLDSIHIDMPVQEVDKLGRRNVCVATIEGLVSREQGNPESRLAEYSIKLENSPLIDKARLGPKERNVADRNALPFELNLTIMDPSLPKEDTNAPEGRTP